jgi:hypothetical protein
MSRTGPWRISDVLKRAGASAEAPALLLESADGYRIEIPWSEVVQCADCIVTIADEGQQAVMPGMYGSR